MRTGRSFAARLFLLAWSAYAVGAVSPYNTAINVFSSSGNETVLYAQDQGGGDSDAAPAGPRIDPADKMYGEAHMKLARRNFKLGNVDRAREELDLVIERIPTHAEARFMRAVIAAKAKDFTAAWRHISIAEQSAPNHPRIKEFVARLEQAMPRPSVIPDEVAARPAPGHASELLGDALEALFANKKATAGVSALGCTGVEETGGKIVAKLTFEGSAPLDENQIKDALKDALKADVTDTTTASAGATLEITVEIPGLPLLNPSAKPVSSLGELLKTASVETDVALKNSSESEPDADKRITGTYTIVAASLRSVNDFMRRLSSEAVDCRIVHLANTTMNEQNVWKGEVRFRFLAP